MNLDYLDFEQPIVELEEKIEELRRVGRGQPINLSAEVTRLEEKSQALKRQIFANLTAKQHVQLARHPLRPHTIDYFRLVFDDFHELQGDRQSASGLALVGGLARLAGEPVMVLGHEKGRSTKEKIKRNFGMPSPACFRKSLRLMKLAEKFRIPVITFIDTPGAYPGVSAEKHNQSGAISRNLYEMSQLQIPIVCVVAGESCSGGALAIGVGDCTIMLEYAYYATISPEGCASILWKNAEKWGEAATVMGLTAQRLYDLGLIDDILKEPLGGAHRNYADIAQRLKQALTRRLNALKEKTTDVLLKERCQHWLRYGRQS